MERHMDVMTLAAGGISVGLTAIHVGTAALSAVRQRLRFARPTDIPKISVIRPLRGIEPFSYATLKSTFDLKPAAAEVLFCVEHAADPIVALVERLIAEHPEIPAQLLVGRDIVSNNPKLNNLAKGWRAAQHGYIAFIDSNVLLPQDALARLVEKCNADTGMVCSPPSGVTQSGFASRLECAFLNTYQARWQSSADAIGHGYAQGKVMFFLKSVVEAGGGLVALGSEPAEDAAATKLIRLQGLHVRLVDRFFEQPIPERTFGEVWSRQLRWAQLRRASFPMAFAAEILTGSLLPLVLTAIACMSAGIPVLPVALIHFGVWYNTELLLARFVGWPSTVVYSITRDVLLPIIWAQAWLTRDFVWHGQAMRAQRDAPANAIKVG
jgi:ceramide glucosyltransferase